MNEKVSRAFTIYVTGNACNMQCSYCYYRNSHPTDQPQPMNLKYSLDVMINAFAPERIGGVAEFTVIGSTETLLAREVIPFVHGLLHYGHVVTVVTNASLTHRIDELLDCPADDLKNLIVKASFHYDELKKKNLMQTYFANIKKVINAGASSFPFVVISPEYVPHLKDISKLIYDNLGIKAHCSPCNKIDDEYDLRFRAEFDPIPDDRLMETLDKYFDTRIYRECVRYKDIDVQKTFCYAGRWSLGVDMESGRTLKCHGFSKDGECFYDNVDRKYEWGEPIAESCAIESCCLQYNFFSEGLLPDFPGKYSFGNMLYQPGMITEYIRDKLDVRFDELYSRLTPIDEARITIANKNIQIQRLEKELSTKFRGNPFRNEIIKKKISEGKKIAIYGRGNVYKQYQQTIDFKVDAYLDSYAHCNETFDGKNVYKPIDLPDRDNYFIVVCVVDKEPLYAELSKAGYDKENYC